MNARASLDRRNLQVELEAWPPSHPEVRQAAQRLGRCKDLSKAPCWLEASGRDVVATVLTGSGRRLRLVFSRS